jgi:hypothetical protein
METTKSYLEKVIERLRLDNGVDIKFLYPEESIMANLDYINWCDRNRLSPYKCLTFFCDYLDGNYDISEDIPKIY